MRSFVLVGLFAASFTGVTAGPLKRDDPSATPSSVIFSFSNSPTSTFPSGTDVPSSVPTGSQGSGGQIYVCNPVDPSTLPIPYPGTPNNATLSAIPSGPVPTSAPSVSSSAPSDSTSASPSPTSGQGSGGPVYICHPAGPPAAPAPIPGTSSTLVPLDPVPTSDGPSVSAPGSTAGVPPPTPTDSKGPGSPVYVCYPADPASVSAPFPSASNNPTLTPIPSDPIPTSTLSISTPSQ